jgi:hypothetical protein
MSDYFDLGSYARPVTTASDPARVWVQRGLLWAYAFNHEEAVACFEQAISADPQCALAYWGVAYALGPNYNKPWETFEPAEAVSVTARTHAAAAAAHRLADQVPVSGPERVLITALASRYPPRARPRWRPDRYWSGHWRPRTAGLIPARCICTST